MYLVEHFYSLQGEGRFVGTPSLFFRFGLCNFECRGFGENGCDSNYAVDPKYKDEWQKIANLADLLNIYKSYNLRSSDDVVITGGEPLLYRDDEIFVQFLEFVRSKNHRITIETNASLLVDFEKFSIYRDVVFAMGVKLSNSLEQKRINKDAINAIVANTKKSFFKFSVVPSLEAKGEIEELRSEFRDTLIFCMAVCETKEELEANSASVVQFCLDNGYSYSDRLHIRLWSDKRGV